MKYVKILGLVLFFFILFSSFALGASGEITLLTVAESVDGARKGSTANILLDVSPGSGRVFINSFPFTREDTQVSVRFAMNFACNFLEIDCSKLDFFYSLDVASSSVGGPSAGAAIAALTIGVLSGENLRDDVVVTGTINSGGIIGPVSGLEEKAVAARDAGFSKILVPKNAVLVNKTFENLNNSDVNLSSDDINLTIFYADSLSVSGIEIVPVSTLEEVLFEFTGARYPDFSFEISVPESYNVIMSEVANQLCSRSEEILNLISDDDLENNSESINQINESLERGFNASLTSDYYSAASFCFTANTALREIEFSSYDNVSLENIATQLSVSIDDSLDDLDNKVLKTISDLETYMIVKERLLEAKGLLEEDNYLSNLGYILERRYSAIAWSSFFEFRDDRSVVLDDVFLANACIAKISEAEERLSYISFLTGSPFDRSDLLETKMFHESEDYAFCIFKASKIKAEANAIILSMSLSRERSSELISDQLMFSRMQINKQGENFPILGYSYYNYASTLKEVNPQLSIIFAEYASEFSNLEMYFPSDRQVPWRLLVGSFKGFISGFFVGLVICAVALILSVLVYRLMRFKKRGKYRQKSKK
ncbi:MAG: S16 family serine protease [Candidatus Woesearchaeota archaeon]